MPGTLRCFTFSLVAFIANLLVIEGLMAQGAISFIARRDFDAGIYPTAVAVEDFNGDAIQDLAVANDQSNNVSILLGNGDGTFQPARNYAAGTAPHDIAVGDFNGDKIPDLVVANFGLFDSGVSLLIGNGDGTFRNAVGIPVNGRPRGVSVGDFNGDNLPDLALMIWDANRVDLLMGNGDGTFTRVSSIAVGRGPSAAAVADFDGDENLDLAVATHDSAAVYVLLGHGDATFRLGQTINVVAPEHVAAGDFDGDGITDLAIAGSGALIWLGNGDGTFRAGGRYEAGLIPTSVAAVDLNGDSVLDLAVTSGEVGGNFMYVLLGNGDGTFEPAQSLAVGIAPWSVACGDFNGDKIPDLAVAGNGAHSVSILLGLGDGTFRSAAIFRATTRPESVAVGDFNGDEIPDVVVVSGGDVQQPSRGSVLLGTGDGSFLPARALEVGGCFPGTSLRYWTLCGPRNVTAADFNGDARLDLAVTNRDSQRCTRDGPMIRCTYTADTKVNILLGRGDGTFGAPTSFAVGAQPGAIIVEDFNGDAIPDLAVLTGASISILLGIGDGAFQAPRSIDVGGSPIFAAAGDFNGDEMQDLVVVSYSGVSILLGNGDGTFAAARSIPTGSNPTSVAIGDFNGDMIPDLAMAIIAPGRCCPSPPGDAVVLLGNGDGTFTAPRSFGVGRSPTFIVVADFNGDTIQDLAVGNRESTNLSLLLGNGDGTFEPAQNFGTVGWPRSIIAADLNGDDRIDLTAVNGTTEHVSVLLNDTPKP